jgi:SnoaL-like domain
VLRADGRPIAGRGALSASQASLTVTDLLAKQAITEVLYRYCRGLDRMDRDMARSVWHDDGTADYGEHYQGSGTGFVDWVWQAHAGFERHSHQITNVLIELLDDDHAVSEAYDTAALRRRTPDGGAVDIISRGRYLDRWSRRDGRWAIDHRISLHDIQTTSEVQPPFADDSPSTARRNREDPSYTFLGW